MMADIEKHRTPLLVQMDKLGKAIFIISGDDGRAVRLQPAVPRYAGFRADALAD
jgi:hypothetical protein